MVVMARTPAREGVKGKRPITAFIVETAWEGVEIRHVRLLRKSGGRSGTWDRGGDA